MSLAERAGSSSSSTQFPVPYTFYNRTKHTVRSRSNLCHAASSAAPHCVPFESLRNTTVKLTTVLVSVDSARRPGGGAAPRLACHATAHAPAHADAQSPRAPWEPESRCPDPQTEAHTAHPTGVGGATRANPAPRCRPREPLPHPAPQLELRTRGPAGRRDKQEPYGAVELYTDYGVVPCAEPRAEARGRGAGHGRREYQYCASSSRSWMIAGI